MKRNRILFVMLLLLVVMTPVSVVHAQGSAVDDLSFGEIIKNLGPRSGQDLMWDLFLYGIFFVGLITMALIPEKQLMASMLILGVVGMAVIAKLLVGDESDPNASVVFDVCAFPTMVLNIGMFVLPMIVAGMVRPHKGKPSKAVLPSIFIGLLGGAHFFLFWATEQRNCPSVAAW